MVCFKPVEKKKIREIVGQCLCLEHKKHQFHIVLFVRNWLLKSVSYLIFFRKSDELILEICMPSKYQYCFVEIWNGVSNSFEI